MKIDGKSIWIYFKFIKLPDYYYGCGKIGHVLKACKNVDADAPSIELQYGA